MVLGERRNLYHSLNLNSSVNFSTSNKPLFLTVLLYLIRILSRLYAVASDRDQEYITISLNIF